MESVTSPSAVLDRVFEPLAGRAIAGQLDPDELDDALRLLASEAHVMDAIGRETLKVAAIRQLNEWNVGRASRLVDVAFKNGEGASRTAQGTAVLFSAVDPWPRPVDGADLIDQLYTTVLRHVAMAEPSAVTVALWVLFAHAHEAFQVSPLLALISPEKRCGKTTTLTLLGALVPNPLPAANITAAALFRAVQRFRPTLLVDEADSFLRDREELRGVLNSGHHRAGAAVVRTVGDDYEPRVFSTWCPKAVALIGLLPTTLEDRSLVIRMRRRRPDENLEALRLDRPGEWEPLRRKCARWVADNADVIRELDPAVPTELHDRAADNWRPLLAVADVAGWVWPQKAREAARALLSEVVEDDTPGVLVLADLRQLFNERSADRLPSADVVEVLGRREDRPWSEWRHGRPITATQLARLLRPSALPRAHC